jgi:hypothetical protein
LGFKERGAEIVLFEDIMEVPISKNNILVADIDATHTHLKRMGIEPPKALNVPEELIEFAGRNIRYMTMGEFKQDKQLPVFIKGNGLAKEYGDIFNAGVITKESSRRDFFNGVPDTFPVLISDYMDIVSEWRGYVINGELKGIKHYLGDIRVFPDMSVVDKAINKYVTGPAGYSIDFGITADGKTILIECNRGYSLGNYGLEPTLYSLLLAKCWIEMITNYATKQ